MYNIILYTSILLIIILNVYRKVKIEIQYNMHIDIIIKVLQFQSKCVRELTCFILKIYLFLFFQRLTERQQTFGEKVIGSLQINNVQVDDGGSYVCQASNMYGRDQQLVQLYVQEPPNKPNNLRVITVSSTTINVQWDHNGEQTSKFIVQHKKSDGTLIRLKI